MTNPAQSKEVNKALIADPDTRKRFKSSLATLTHYFRQMDDIKDGLKDGVADVASEYGLDKKLIRKMASTMYKANYGSLQEENRHFEVMYEMVVEGKLRDPDDMSNQPVDLEDTED